MWSYHVNIIFDEGARKDKNLPGPPVAGQQILPVVHWYPLPQAPLIHAPTASVPSRHLGACEVLLQQRP